MLPYPGENVWSWKTIFGGCWYWLLLSIASVRTRTYRSNNIAVDRKRSTVYQTFLLELVTRWMVEKQPYLAVRLWRLSWKYKYRVSVPRMFLTRTPWMLQTWLTKSKGRARVICITRLVTKLRLWGMPVCR